MEVQGSFLCLQKPARLDSSRPDVSNIAGFYNRNVTHNKFTDVQYNYSFLVPLHSLNQYTCLHREHEDYLHTYDQLVLHLFARPIFA
jgi:hypothetical protein